jgi:acetolactate synthase-1/2/3 large subunit
MTTETEATSPTPPAAVVRFAEAGAQPGRTPLPTAEALPVLKSAGHVIVDSLMAHGVERTYVVPGESFLDVLDGLHGSSIDTIVCRHEGGAAYMAEADGKMNQRPASPW